MSRGKKQSSPPDISQTRPPSFESGVLAEPLLAFGGQHKHPSQKTGLGLYGPYSLKGRTARSSRPSRSVSWARLQCSPTLSSGLRPVPVA